MPSDVMTLMITTGLGVSVIAGILSGVCYVLVQGYKTQRSRKPSPQWYCAVCNRHLRSIEGVLDTDRIVTCTKCGKKICKQRCSKYRPLEKSWICQICRREPPWFENILNAIQPNSKLFKFNYKMDDQERIEEIDEDIEAIRKKEKEQVRDFIERLVAAMLGGTVDDASIAKIYNDKSYEALFERYHQDLVNALIDLGSALHISIANLPVTGQSPCTAHATLKHLIEKLIREALDLPTLNQRNEEHPAVPSDENERTYEDLLATATINKVVNNCQNQSSSAAPSVSSRPSSSSKYKNKEYYFGDETLDSKWKNTDLDTTSVSSLEEWLHSDSSIGSTKFIDKVSLTIQQRIEEVLPSDSENEEDDSEYFRTSSSLLSADDCNWYLQKRHFQGTHSPVPVPMLVPNPTTDAKVLIGDKEVDDTSDLSDAASDYGEIETTPALNSLLVESKTVIGGKNLITGEIRSGEESDAESSADSGVKEDSRYLYEEEEKPKADISIDDENIEDASLLSIYSNTEKDTEYTEKYASLPRTITKSPIERNSNESGIVEDKEEFGGYYSKKEKEKWNNPIQMKHNPYTKENIERRIRSSKTFGRDYYLRQASLPSGARKTEEINLPRPKSTDEEDTYRAIPTIIDDDPEIVQNSEEISEITSDSDLSFVNCYDVEHSKIFRKSSDGGEQEIKISVNTEGLLYISKDPDEEENNLCDTQPKTVEDSKIVNTYDIIDEVPFSFASNVSEELPPPPEVQVRVNTVNLIPEPNIEIPPERDENDNVATPKLITPEVKPRSIKPIAPKRNKKIESENFDSTPPTIITKKSDNTLIRKIYSDPKVRSFALINREQIPVEYKNEKNSKQQSPETPNFERTFSKELTSTPNFERIISNEKNTSPAHFERTYSNGVAKSQPPAPLQINNVFDLSEESIKRFEVAERSQSSDSEVLSDNFSLEFSDIEPPTPRQKLFQDPEISELKEKRLVASRLGEFSRSFPNLSRIFTPIKEEGHHKEYENKEQNGWSPTLSETSTNFVSVKDLKKRFEINENLSKSKPVHSLTARSISKPMREKLKSDDDDTIYVIEGIVDCPQYVNVEETAIDTEQKVIIL